MYYNVNYSDMALFMTGLQNKPRNAFNSLDLQVRCLQGYCDMHISTASTSLKYLNSAVIAGNCSTRDKRSQ